MPSLPREELGHEFGKKHSAGSEKKFDTLESLHLHSKQETISLSIVNNSLDY
jgi:hypothetical protein